MEMSKLKLSEFDHYGMFHLQADEAEGIKDYVHKLDNNDYLSRNANYYPDEAGKVRFAEICAEYERLNSLLPASGKPGFVICEKMHELAIRTVNTIQQTLKTHLFQDDNHFDTTAQRCVQECADNLLRIIHDEPAQRTISNLSDEKCLQPKDLVNPRIPFVDNKKQLYLCANAIPDEVEHLITPGRGSSKLGSFVQAVRKYKGLKPLGFTQIYYSLYYNKQYDKVFPEPIKNLPEKIWVMDDIIYNGYTLSHIKNELKKQGHQVTNGAVTSSFYGHIFQLPDWANYIDIIPNQYSHSHSSQFDLQQTFRIKNSEKLKRKLKFKLRNDHGKYSADYASMRAAEQIAGDYGADLYQESVKISKASVEYNHKIREQIAEHDLSR